MSKQTTTPSITLDSIFDAMEHWRNNKNAYEGNGIPDKIWKMLFAFEDNGCSGSRLRKMFGLNSEQYNRKRLQLSNAVPPPASKLTTTDSKQDKPVQFGEAIVVKQPAQDIQPLSAETTAAATRTRQTIKKLKSSDYQEKSYIDTTTVIVECIRDDGQRLKIHTTNDRLDVILNTFYAEGAAAS